MNYAKNSSAIPPVEEILLLQPYSPTGGNYTSVRGQVFVFTEQVTSRTILCPEKQILRD